MARATKARTALNPADIKDAVAAIMPHGFVPDRFIWNFIKAYGVPQSIFTNMQNESASPRAPVLWKPWVHYQQALPGDVNNTLAALAATPRTNRNKARFVISTDGDEFAARDLTTEESLYCSFGDLAEKYDFFLPIAGIDRYVPITENPVDVKATKKLSNFYDEIIIANPEWKQPERQHDLNHFMTQIIFCLFAEDTGIFPDNLFAQTLRDRCAASPRETASTLKPIFDAMSVDGDERLSMPGYAVAFPFVNGGLFRGDNLVPLISLGAYRYLMEATELDWGDINPDIFGSMIQAIADADKRSELGMHYTSVPNILKVLDPLFLDALREAKTAAWDSQAKLLALLERMSKIRVFDPACGSGNFLVIAYREMRKIEIDIMERLQDKFRRSASLWSHIHLKNFFGIEYLDFPCETARLALWIAEYQMNKRYGDVFGKRPAALPLRDACIIQRGNALRLDWADVCPIPDDAAGETYIVGNPPYLGSKRRKQEQKVDIENLFSPFKGKSSDLDYVAGWFLKAGQMLEQTNGGAAFVGTNSICQGQQVAMLWPVILDLGMEIGFAHRSFKWSNLAKNNAGVTCVIVGIRKRSAKPKYIFDKDSRHDAFNISPYLLDIPNIIIRKTSRPLAELPEMKFGNMPRDGGHLILSPSEKEAMTRGNPDAEGYIRPFVGSQEFIKGFQRYCIWIEDDGVSRAKLITAIARRLELVTESRLASDAPSTREFANRPHRFVQIQSKSDKAIIIAGVSSEHREYLPVGWLTNGEIISNKCFAIYDGPMWVIALIASRLHHIWIATVCVRLEMRFSYSNTLGWNTFPVPALSAGDKTALTTSAENILLARDRHPGKTIAQLYDPENMPDNMRDAHRTNDALVEGLYSAKPFTNDTARLEHLFDRYVTMINDKEGRSIKSGVKKSRKAT